MEFSQRTVSKGVWCSDSAQCGPLQRTIAHLEKVWRGVRPDGKEWHVEQGGVDGLWVCPEFLSLEEVQVLRTVFNAHNNWSMYNWGNVGRHNELASVLQRIDFGVEEMTAEGVAAARSSVQPIGELQQALITLLEERMRAAFGRVAWGGEEGPTHPDCRPNMLQFTRIAPGTCLGNHFDRRDKWDEGIASIAWGEAPGHRDPRGDEVRPRLAADRARLCRPRPMRGRQINGRGSRALGFPCLLAARRRARCKSCAHSAARPVVRVRAQWLLRMQCGPNGPGQKEVTRTIPPGAAYILSGVAQGRTGFCEQRRVAHNMCSCCWTHGIWNEASMHTRESITMRVFDTEWGRDVVLCAVAVVESDDDEEQGEGAAEGGTEGEGGGEGGGGEDAGADADAPLALVAEVVAAESE